MLSVADEVFDLLTQNHADVFAVTETWLDPCINDCEIFPYSSSIGIVCRDRNCPGGGVVFLLSPRVKFVVGDDLSEGHTYI